MKTFRFFKFRIPSQDPAYDVHRWISQHSKRLVGSQFEAWAKELPRFAALWLGRKTQTLSDTSQKPGRPQPTGTGLVKQCSQEFMLENFCRAFSSDPTHCPWISDNDFTAEYDYIDSLCTAVPSPQTKSRGEMPVSQSLSPRFFLGEGRLYTGYFTDWQSYCFHWSLANCWPPREACIRLKDWCKMWLNWQKDPSTFFFSSFDNDQLATIHWRCRIEGLKIRKHTKFKCDTSKASKDIAPQGTKFYTLVNLGISCAVSQYHVANRARTRERACLSRALRASHARLLFTISPELVRRLHITFKLGIFTCLKAFF